MRRIIKPHNITTQLEFTEWNRVHFAERKGKYEDVSIDRRSQMGSIVIWVFSGELRQFPWKCIRPILTDLQRVSNVRAHKHRCCYDAQVVHE